MARPVSYAECRQQQQQQRRVRAVQRRRTAGGGGLGLGGGGLGLGGDGGAGLQWSRAEGSVMGNICVADGHFCQEQAHCVHNQAAKGSPITQGAALALEIRNRKLPWSISALRPTGVPPCHPWASPGRQRRHRDDLPAGVNVGGILGMQPQLGVATTAPYVGLVCRAQVAFWAAAAPLRQREGQQACAQGGSKPLRGSRVEGQQRWNCRAAGIAELKMTRPAGHLSPGS